MVRFYPTIHDCKPLPSGVGLRINAKLPWRETGSKEPSLTAAVVFAWRASANRSQQEGLQQNLSRRRRGSVIAHVRSEEKVGRACQKGSLSKEREEARGRCNRSVTFNCHMSGRQCLHSGAVKLRWVNGLDVLNRETEALSTCFDIMGHPDGPPPLRLVEKVGGGRGVAPRPVRKKIGVKPITGCKAWMEPPCRSTQTEE